MKAFLAHLFAFQLLALAAWAQGGLSMIDRMAEFKGGQRALREYLQQNLKYPPRAEEQKLAGTVLVSFFVDSMGRVSRSEILQSTNPIFEDEAMRLVNSFPPFEPARSGNRRVAVRMSLPINFRLAGSEKPPAVAPVAKAAQTAEYFNLPDFNGWYALVDRRTADFNKMVIRTPEGKALEKSDRYFIFTELPLAKFADLKAVVESAILPSPTTCSNDVVKVLEEGKLQGMPWQLVLAESPSCQTLGTQPAPRSALVYAIKGKQRYYLQYVYYWQAKFPEKALQDWRNYFKLGELKYTAPAENQPVMPAAALAEANRTPELKNAYVLSLGIDWPAGEEARTIGSVRRSYKRPSTVFESCQEYLVLESFSTPNTQAVWLDSIPHMLQAELAGRYKKFKVTTLSQDNKTDNKTVLYRMSCEGAKGSGCAVNQQYLIYAQSANYEQHISTFIYPSKKPDAEMEQTWVQKLKSGRFVPAE